MLASLTDSRPRPQIRTETFGRAVLVMLLSRLGSLHALEQTHASRWWRSWLTQPLPSADSLGRIATRLDLGPVREGLHGLYIRLRRGKALGATSGGLIALVLDGHELRPSYLRCCSGCLSRRIKTRSGYRTLYCHRIVAARLATRSFGLWLDVESVADGEDEIGAALRLLERVLARYPRAFDVVVADALYSDSRIYHLVRSHAKDVLTVLKRNTPALLDDAQALFATQPAVPQTVGRVTRSLWDVEGFTSWTEVGCPVRVVRSCEHTQVRRQLDRSAEDILSQWTWVTTLSTSRAGTSTVVDLGHARWSIENEGFNEGVNHWHLDHLYHHQPQAILAYILLSLLAINLASAFYWRNLHPHRRQRSSALHVARLLTAELIGREPDRPP